MKKSIIISNGAYGFGHTWQLLIKGKNFTKVFYLGQDAKFCNRVLGMEPSDVVSAIGTRYINEGEVGNTKLANFIYKQLELTSKKIKSLERWSLACD